MKIVCAHLLNDFSGSSRMLAQAITVMLEEGFEVELFVNKGSQGHLSALPVKTGFFSYRWSRWRVLTLVRFLASQVELFLRAVTCSRNGTVFYVNTYLPVGLALAGKLTRKSVIYHLHETSVSPQALKAFLKWIAWFTADRVIFVSDYLRSAESPISRKETVVRNWLDQRFLGRVSRLPEARERGSDFIVMMLCSLRDYKGVPEFVELAGYFENECGIHFELVLNATSAEVEDYFGKLAGMPSNLRVFSRTAKVEEFYLRASLVANLSRPTEWIETYGLTILEAMAFGVPVISPTVGGPAELVRHGVDGYQVDSQDVNALADVIRKLWESPRRWQEMSSACQERAKMVQGLTHYRALLGGIRQELGCG